MKQLNSLEIHATIRELQTIRNAKIEKIYQPEPNELLIHLYHPTTGKQYLRIISGTAIFLTNHKKESHNFPPHFCMFLRKHLNNSTIETITQKQGDRIIEIKLKTKEGEKKLIIELFNKGNIIITNQEDEIISLLKVQVFRDRELRIHKKYQPPPQTITPLNLNRTTYNKIINNADQEIVKTLATLIGLGGEYAEETLQRAKIEKNKKTRQLTTQEKEKIYETIDNLVRTIKYKPLKPSIIKNEENETINYEPIPLIRNEKNKKTPTKTFNEALDAYYTEQTIKQKQEKTEQQRKQEIQKLEHIKQEQEQTIKQYQEITQTQRNQGEWLKQNLTLLENARQVINNALNKGLTWQEIEQRLETDKQRNVPQALLIKELDPINKGFITTNNTLIKLNQTVGEQINQLYTTTKKTEQKIENAEQHYEETKKQIEQTMKTPIQETEPQLKPITNTTQQKEWYEKFKHFTTSNNHLFIAGKNADQNEEIIKRYMRDSDKVFHADIIGSPFGILRLEEGEQPTEQELLECATFTGSHSRAWREGLTLTDVYWVEPNQISKEGGLQKGSFMIYGKRNYYYNVELKLAIGLKNNEIISGPISAVKKQTNNYITITPGNTPTNETIKTLKQELGYQGNEDDFTPHLPPGEHNITKPETIIRYGEENEEDLNEEDDFFMNYEEFTL